jgi:hypothetical protein
VEEAVLYLTIQKETAAIHSGNRFPRGRLEKGGRRNSVIDGNPESDLTSKIITNPREKAGEKRGKREREKL